MPVFESSHLIKSDIERCWKFFSDPSNLSLITPPEMKFSIISPDPVPPMYAGMVIRYTVRPLFGVPLKWITEITQVKEHHFFIDNQVKGPFRLWHHQHFFTETNQGVLMRDVVTYELPFGFIGRLFGSRIVAARVKHIFAHRSKVIDHFFGTGHSGPA